jgi:hypothetical protein
MGQVLALHIHMVKRNTYPWKRIVEDARAHDGWLLPPELIAVPVRVAQGIRLLRHPDLMLSDGVLDVRAVDPWTDQEGTKRATLYVRFVPYHET